MRTQSQASQGDSQISTDTRTARQAQTNRQTRRGLGRVRQTRQAVSQSSSSASHPKPYHSVNPWPRATALDSTDQTQYSQASASAHLRRNTGVQYRGHRRVWSQHRHTHPSTGGAAEPKRTNYNHSASYRSTPTRTQLYHSVSNEPSVRPSRPGRPRPSPALLDEPISTAVPSRGQVKGVSKPRDHASRLTDVAPRHIVPLPRCTQRRASYHSTGAQIPSTHHRT